jgi:hypothetical protein
MLCPIPATGEKPDMKVDLCREIKGEMLSRNTLEMFIDDYDTYEETPLLSRFKQMDFVREHMRGDALLFLVNFACFYLNQIILYANARLSSEEREQFLIFLRFDAEERDPEYYGCLIPRFLYTKKEGLFRNLMRCLDKNSLETFPDLKRVFERLGLIDAFEFCTSVDGRFLYAVPVFLKRKV